MNIIITLRPTSKEKTMSVKYSCCEGLKKLKKGNSEHIHRIKTKCGKESFQTGFTGKVQKPYAAILSCADSRVVPEFIFSANAGDLFVVRVAGNIANTSSIASLEYAVNVLKVRVIVVLGHESCGAVEAAICQAKTRTNLGTNLNDLTAHIVPAINQPTINNLAKATKRNAKLVAGQLVAQSEILKGYYKSNKLGIFNGYYVIYGNDAGKVENINKWSCP